eukprot:8662711-Pyramimonas_sp.AAC.1
MHSDRSIAELLSALCWPFAVPARETLGLLAEVDFKVVPPKVSGPLLSAFKGFGHSALCDNGFRVVKKRGEKVKRMAIVRQ